LLKDEKKRLKKLINKIPNEVPTEIMHKKIAENWK